MVVVVASTRWRQWEKTECRCAAVHSEELELRRTRCRPKADVRAALRREGKNNDTAEARCAPNTTEARVWPRFSWRCRPSRCSSSPPWRGRGLPAQPTQIVRLVSHSALILDASSSGYARPERFRVKPGRAQPLMNLDNLWCAMLGLAKHAPLS